MIITFDKINRLIIIQKPDTEVSCQELINAIRDFEDELENLDIPKIANAAGKDNLGGGVLVGITITLLNWKVAFEARTELEGWTICSISGGNLVAVDGNGTPMSPISPSAYVNITLANSSSATLQESTLIQYAAFNNQVTINVDNGVPGTNFPIGTRATPVNNYEDAMTIAMSRGFNTFFIFGTLTLSDSCENFVYVGQNHETSKIIINNGQHLNTSFIELSIEGVFADDSFIETAHCEVGDVENITINMHDCILSGTIILNDTEPSNLFNCTDGIPGSGTPILDVDICENLGVWNYSGGLKLINMTLPTEVSLNLSSGRVVLDSTCTAGNVIIRGIGSLVNNSTGVTLNKIGLLDLTTITSSVWGADKLTLTDTSTIGGFIAKKLMTVSKFLGLK
jgi:hypothetical protein